MEFLASLYPGPFPLLLMLCFVCGAGLRFLHLKEANRWNYLSAVSKALQLFIWGFSAPLALLVQFTMEVVYKDDPPSWWQFVRADTDVVVVIAFLVALCICAYGYWVQLPTMLPQSACCVNEPPMAAPLAESPQSPIDAPGNVVSRLEQPLQTRSAAPQPLEDPRQESIRPPASEGTQPNPNCRSLFGC